MLTHPQASRPVFIPSCKGRPGSCKTEVVRTPELVDITQLDPTLKLDVRYARADNFIGRAVYTLPMAFLQRPVAEDLVRIHQSLAAEGLGIVVFDGYRPWSVTKIFWDETPEHNRRFVADPANGSVHNRGAAVDLSLFNRETGEILAMPSEFDEMTERSYFDYPGGTDEQRRLRDLLRSRMEHGHFYGIKYEWWHFNHRLFKEYPVLNLSFEELASGSAKSEESS